MLGMIGRDVDGSCTVPFLIELAVAMLKYVADQRRDAAPGLIEQPSHIRHAKRVERLERAEFPAEAPAHGIIDVGNAVRDLGHPARAVGEKVKGHLARETG